MPQLIWLVTGCSSGIGESFVYEILSRGDKVIASSRGTSSRLAHLQVGAKILAIDINTPQVKLDQKIEEATGFYGGINVLVNNAGFFDWNVIEETRYIQFLSNPLK
jgi:short-subunit dehydrogenase